jgi:hypothetical protein
VYEIGSRRRGKDRARSVLLLQDRVIPFVLNTWAALCASGVWVEMGSFLLVMNNRICICCGEPMSDAEIGTWKENPNVCFACSSFLDEPGENLPEPEPSEAHAAPREKAEVRVFDG